MSRCWWMWITSPSAPSASRPRIGSRSASTAELLSHGGGPVWRPGIAPQSTGFPVEVAADAPDFRVSTTPRTIPTIASATTTPPTISRVRRLPPPPPGPPFERTGGAVVRRGGGGPSPAFFLADCLAIGARGYQRRAATRLAIVPSDA